MESIPPGVQPPRPINPEKDISQLFEEVKKIRSITDNFDTYKIDGSTYSQLMNSIMTLIINATTYKLKNQTADLQQALIDITRITGVQSLDINDNNIQNWNAHVHYTRLAILNHFIPNFYAFLILFINTYLITNRNVSISQKYRHRSNQTPDDNLRDYYDTAKNILNIINTNDDVNSFTDRFIQNMLDEETAQKKGNADKDVKVRERAEAVIINRNFEAYLYRIITPLTTSFNDSTGNKVTRTFYIQNFGGDGDCLFLTLLAILKVFRRDDLATVLNKYQQGHTDIFKVPYTNNVANRKYDASILRHVIVEYISTHLDTHVFPAVERNQQQGLSASTSVDTYGGTYGNRLTLPAGTKPGGQLPNGGANTNTGKILFLNGEVQTRDGHIISIDTNIQYPVKMKIWNTWGTDVELAAATQLFDINIININTDGNEQPFLSPRKLDDDFDAYIFHDGVTHYMNIWPNNTRDTKTIWAVNCAPARTAIHPESQPPQESQASRAPASRASPPSLPSKTQSDGYLPSGVVQVFQGDGDWEYEFPSNVNPATDNLAKQNAESIFKPILYVIDALINQGYDHIGLTYSANQDQTAEMFTAYDFNHNEKRNLSDKVLKQKIKPSSFSQLAGSGQAFVLGFHKNVLSDKKYSTKFRIIPFSTMKHGGAKNGLSPEKESLGSIDDCKQFADLFLGQKNSIILGWSTDKVKYKLNESNVKGILSSPGDIIRWISIGGRMCRNGVKNPIPGLDIMTDYARWALTNWNPDAQKLVDNLSSTSPIPKAHVKHPSKGPSSPPPTPKPGLNDPNGFITEITKRIGDIRSAASKLDPTGWVDVKHPIAILVNGGSFNPIHNGHLEMFTLARQRLLGLSSGGTPLLRANTGGGPTYFDVLVIYVVSPFAELQVKNASDPSKITYDEEGKKNRIKLCREAFASIDDVNPKPNEIKRATDGNHLSKNMFVSPVENGSPNEFGKKLSDDFSSSGITNVTFYGLAGSDKVIPESGKPIITPDEKYYFLNGINGFSVIVGRDKSEEDVKSVFTSFDTSNLQNPPTTQYEPKNGKISIGTISSVSSTIIQPRINQLRNYLISMVAKEQYKKRIVLPNCTDGNKQAKNCIPYAEQNLCIYQIQNMIHDIPVPRSILFKLVTDGEEPIPSITNNEPDQAWCGYKEFRRYLFRNKLDNLTYQYVNHFNFLKNELKKYQLPYEVTDKLPFTPIKKNGVIIEFLQMTSGHALFIQGPNSANTSVLNFANPTYVGGGLWYGSWVQEETLCMMSPLLYLTLASINDIDKRSEDEKLSENEESKYITPRHIYETVWGEKKWNKKFFYTAETKALDFDTTDEFTFGFHAPWIQRTDDYSKRNYYVNTTTTQPQWKPPVPPFKGHVITAAAYDWKHNRDQSSYAKNTEFNKSMISMIQHMAYVAATQQNCNVLVLGAWGCGAFAPKSDTMQQGPASGYIEHVARLFCRALYTVIPGEDPIKYKDLFDKVIFPIPDCNTYDKFKEAFDAEEVIQKGGGVIAEHAEYVSGEDESEGEGEGDDEWEVSSVESGEGGIPPSSTQPAIVEVPPPYITLTNMIAGIDSGIDHFVDKASNRNPLREISVNEQGTGAANRTKDILKFSRVDGDFPKSTVPLFEQMIYHRAGSMNLNPLAIFVPTGYKINFQEITEYFKEMARRNDPETQELMTLVINAYGNNNNSLFYRHTLPGKVSTSSSSNAFTQGGFMVGGAPATIKNVFDLDAKAAERIQIKIDNWHKQYTDWQFYQNATRFFVQNQTLPKNELLSLKIVFDDLFDSSSTGNGLMKIIEDIQKKHSGDHAKSIDGINDVYLHYGEKINKNVIINTLLPYIQFFNTVFEDIKQHMSDTLSFTQSRQNDLGYKYKFDQTVKNDLFKIYSDIKNILDSFGHDIQDVPYLKLIDLFQVFTQQINELNRRFPSQLKDIFHSGISKNDRLTYHRDYYKTYKLIQYVYWLMSDRKALPDPFDKKNYDRLLPHDVVEKANLRRSDDLKPDFDKKKYKQAKESVSNPRHFEESRDDRRTKETYVDMAENEKKHISRLIRIYQNEVYTADDELKEFIDEYMAFSLSLKSYLDIYDRSTIDLQFGIDLLFYVLYYVTNNVVSELNKKKHLFDKIDDKNGELFALRQDIRLKESKLAHIFDLISKQIGIPVERIMPDRASYYYSKTSTEHRKAGLIKGRKYHDEWQRKLSSSSSDSLSKKINYVTTNMKNSLNKALGLVDDANGTKKDVKEENRKKMKSALIELLEHNTVQVVHMLFAKPRDIWYSPDMRIGSLSAVSKWVFFRLEKPEIVTKSASKMLKDTMWDKVVTSTSGSSSSGLTQRQPRLNFIINKTPATQDVFEIKIVDDNDFNTNKLPSGQGGLCVLLIASQPSPQMIEPGKDSSNDSRFQNPSFSVGDTQPAVRDDHAIGSKIMDNLTRLIKPDPQKCNNVRGLIQEQTNELSAITKNLLKSIGVESSIQLAGLKNKLLATSTIYKAMSLLSVDVDHGNDLTTSPPQANIDKALQLTKSYGGDPDFDAVIGYCDFLNALRSKPPEDSKIKDSVRKIITASENGSEYSLTIIGYISTHPKITEDIQGIILDEFDDRDKVEETGEGVEYKREDTVGGRRRRNYIGGTPDELKKIAVRLLKRAAKTNPFAKVKLVKMRLRREIEESDLSDKEAMQMLQIAADDSYTPAEYFLGTVFQDGELGQNKDLKEAVKYYERAAARGHKDASYKLGLLYKDGVKDVVRKDLNKAIKLLEASAKEEEGIVEFDYTLNFTKEEAPAQIADEIKSVIKAQNEIKRQQTINVGESPETTPEEPDDVLKVAAKEASMFLEDEALRGVVSSGGVDGMSGVGMSGAGVRMVDSGGVEIYDIPVEVDTTPKVGAAGAALRMPPASSEPKHTGYRGGIGKEKKVTRKHRDEHERVEETTKHTRKHKLYTLSLNKTRRNK